MGLAGFTYVDVGGRLSVAELLCCVVFLVTVIQGAYQTKEMRWLVPSVSILILGAAFGDLAHRGEAEVTAITNLAANYLVLAISILVLANVLLASGGRAVLPLLGGAALGQICGFLLTPTVSALIDPWKFGLGWSATVLAMFLIQSASTRTWYRPFAMVVLTTMASVNFLFGSRSAGTLIAICGLLTLWRVIEGRRRQRTAFVLVLTGLAGIFFVTLAYEGITQSGALGFAAADKLVNQSGEFGILFGARKELVLLVVAWAASPLFGWGSLAAVDSNVSASTLGWFLDHGYQINPSDYQRLFQVSELPLHSVVLGGLVQAGIFAIPLGFFLVRRMLKGIHATFAVRDLLGLFITLSGLTHLLTSPLGDSTRFVIAIGCAYGVYWMQNRRVGDVGKEATKLS